MSCIYMCVGVCMGGNFSQLKMKLGNLIVLHIYIYTFWHTTVYAKVHSFTYAYFSGLYY